MVQEDLDPSENIPKDLKLELQQLVLSRDPVLQSKESLGPTDEYLDRLAPIIKHSLKNDTTEELTETLKGILQLKDREIEGICGGGHNEYMVSVQHLGEVSRESEEIKSIVLDVSARIRQSGKQLASKKEFLAQARQLRGNLDASIEAVSSCLEVLNLTNKVHQLLKDKSKFEAFKALEDLRNAHHHNLADFGFAKIISKSIPDLAKIVRTETLNDFTKWVSHIDQTNAEIGHMAFNLIREKRNEWRQIVYENPELRRYKFNSPVEQSYRDSSSSGNDFSQIDVDLAPLYECVLVHSSLGLLKEFQHHFESDRKVRSNYLVPKTLHLNQSDGNGDDDIYEVEALLQTVAGFCIIDRLVSRRIPGLRPSKEVDDLWETINQKLNTLLTSALKEVTDGNTFKQLKELLGSFLYTMQNYDFNTSGIENVILSLFQSYSLILKTEFQEKFNDFLEKDDAMPMVIRSKQEFDKLRELAWYEDTPPDTERFPLQLPFSEIYPLFCTQIRGFIRDHQSFLEELQNDPTTIEDIVNKQIDDLLIDTVCARLKGRLHSSSREEIIQILINLKFFWIAASSLEDVLSRERISGRRGKVKLKACDEFAQTRQLAEQSVFELLNNVIDNFVSLADYDWNTDVVSVEPSQYLSDMAPFIKTLVTSTFARLPENIKSFVYLNAFAHLESEMLQMLLDAPSISLAALHNFDIDVQFLESFLNELSDMISEDGLSSTIVKLRQSVDLLSSENVEEYNDNDTRAKKYSQITPDRARMLVAKITDSRIRQQAEANAAGSAPNSPNVSAGSPRITSSSKIRQYYQRGVEKLSEKRDNHLI